MAIVGVMFNLKGEAPEEEDPPDQNAELDSPATIDAIATALRSHGHDVCLIEGNASAVTKLRRKRPDIVFNMCEGVRGESRESQIPCALEMLGIPYSGSGPLALAVTLDKPLAKKILTYHGVPNARFKVFEPESHIDCRGLSFPVFAKPAHEGSSIGVSPTSRAENAKELRAEVKRLIALYRQPVLVEEYLPGREFTVGILGNREPVFFPVMEINFDPVPQEHGQVYSRLFKTDWSGDEYYLCPAPISPEFEAQLRAVALKAYRVLGCRDLSRVDLRLDKNGIPNVMEINPLPGMSPGFSDYPRMAEKGGWSYAALVNGILETALRRANLHHLTAGAFQTQIAD